MRSKTTILVSFGLIALFSAGGSAQARPTQQEKAVFLAEQRQQKEAFNMSILEETDPRAAESSKFNQKTKASRIALIQSISNLPQNEKSERLAEFNRSALVQQKDFEKKLLNVPLSKNPKISDLVAKRKKFNQEQIQKVRDFFNG